MKLDVDTSYRHAERLVDLLVDVGPVTAVQACEKLGWSRGRFTSALRIARTEVCPPLDLAIPTPTPQAGWLYQVTTEWEPVEEGASHSLGHVESRLLGIHRDIGIVKPHLTRGSKEWRRANFLDKHLSHMLATLSEINGD
jgi:hypothetical protein